MDAPAGACGGGGPAPPWRPLWRSRWLGLVLGLWLQACGGCSYNFGLYSGSIKAALGYDQRALDALATAKDVGGNVGIVSGFLYDAWPPWAVLLVGAAQTSFGYAMLWLAVTRRIAPPRPWQMAAYICVGTNGATFFNTAVLVTAVKNFPASRGTVVGLMKVGWPCAPRWPQPPPTRGRQARHACLPAGLPPLTRPCSVMLASEQGFIGLSGAIFTQIYTAAYAPDQESFLLLVAWLPSLVALAVLLFIRVVPSPPDASERRKFLFVYGAGIALAIYLLVVILLEHMYKLSRPANVAVTVVMIVLLVLPLAVPLVTQWELAQRQHGGAGELGDNELGSGTSPAGPGSKASQGSGLLKRHSGHALEEEQALLPAHQGSAPPSSSALRAPPPPPHPPPPSSPPPYPAHEDEKAPSKSSDKLQPRRGDDFTLLQARDLLDNEAWTCTSIIGDAIAIETWQAVRTSDFWLLFGIMLCGAGSGLTVINNLGQIGSSLDYDNIGAFVSLLSIWNFLGRLGGGLISEHFVRARGMPRPLLMAVTQLGMGGGHLLFASALPGALYPASVVIGMTYGAQWALMPATASELFGLRHFGTMYNWLACANPIGSYLLSVQVAGTIYDREAKRQGGSAPPPLGPPVCHGPHCFRLTFLVMATVCMVGACTAVVLSMRTRAFYLQQSQQRGPGSPTSSTGDAEEDDEPQPIRPT
eukprot:SM000400S15605  [mRNA]  locus=s400:18012:20578:- [translate_table: standard]